MEVAHGVGPGRIDIAYERFGPDESPPVLLIMGLGTQMLGWPDGFCSELVGRGVHVVRFDNRDVGLSSHLTEAPPYTLSDMAADTVGLLDALELDSAHLVGASMGGMIAQAAAIEHPQRVRSLTSIMSTTGDPSVGQPTEAALSALLSPPAATRADAIERTVSIVRVIGSPGFELDEADLRRRTGVAYDRAYDPGGIARQITAITSSGDRTASLRSISVPTLVIHGEADPLVDVSGGRATAGAIAGAELAIFEGMGHDLPRALWRDIVGAIAELVDRAEAVR